MPENKKFFKTNEAAEFLGVSRSSLVNWVKLGLLSRGLTPGGHYRFSLTELTEFAIKRGLSIDASFIHSKKTKILIIEDDFSFREFVHDVMESFQNYELKEAVDGIQGALIIGNWHPDLIILDIRMPKMNGVEFLRVLRNNPETAHIDVIITSAHLSEDVKKHIDELGVSEILEKPVHLSLLINSIQKIAELELA